MKMSKDQVIEKLMALVKEQGHDWTKIAAVLNDRKILTATGRKWNPDSARSFYRTHVSPKRPLDAKKPPEKESMTSPPELPKWMDTEAQRDLEDMLEWWRKKKSSPLREIQARPVFRGKRINSGFHINETILRKAQEKVKTDKLRSGGSLSLLVELLLWRYIGSPEDVLEQ
jgi:hypothetical protein